MKSSTIIVNSLVILSIFGSVIEIVEGKWCNTTVLEDKVRHIKVEKIVERRKDIPACRLINYSPNLICTYNATEYEEKPEYYKEPSVVPECCSGYRLEDSKCFAICSNGCENGHCTEPEVCQCQEGYVVDSPFRCKPFCTSCLHGSCVAPNKCDCPEQYVPIETDAGSDCEPYCLNCTNGKCIAPGDCLCNDGYFLSNEVCTPLCEKCELGECISPGVCVCKSGYTYSSEGEGCVPICDTPCINGYCDQPNQCKCIAGYTATNETNCVPFCDNNCPANSQCIAPYHCFCDPGYYEVFNAENDLIQCLPICDPPCLNGHCKGPDQCVCNEGYLLHSEDHQCHPVCDINCSNGYGIAPQKCECNQGYQVNCKVAYMAYDWCGRDKLPADCCGFNICENDSERLFRCIGLGEPIKCGCCAIP